MPRFKTRAIALVILLGIALPLVSGSVASPPDSSTKAVPTQNPVAPHQSATPAPDTGHTSRSNALMQRLHQKPYPPQGPWHFLGQAMGSFWVGDNKAGNVAVPLLKAEMDKRTEAREEGDEAPGLQWQVGQVARLIFLFGQHGIRTPGAMTSESEVALKDLLWSWVEPRARRGLVDPSRDWWLWGSENLHLQTWFGIWSALTLFVNDPAYASRSFADGSTVGELKLAFDDYFKRWIRNRATRGLFVECGSPTYTNYSLGGFYNAIDFSTDPELKRLATAFMDVYWAQWALESMEGLRGGSRHRSYAGLPSLKDGAGSGEAYYYFGLGNRQPTHPGVWPMATSSYVPPQLVWDIVKRRGELGNYQITSRLPGLSDAKVPTSKTYSSDPKDPMSGGVYHLDPRCENLRRVTYATPAFVMGTSMVPALPKDAWTGISGQNHWDGILFKGGGGYSRIFVQPQVLSKGSIYNANWSIEDRGVLLIQRLAATNAKTQRVWFSQDLTHTEKGGWVFAQAAYAYCAVKVVRGTWHWDTNSVAYFRKPSDFVDGLGTWLAPDDQFTPLVIEVSPKTAYPNFEAFQQEILANPVKLVGSRLDYTSHHYGTTLSMFTDYKNPPLFNGEAVSYEAPQAFDSEMLQSTFGSSDVHLKAFGKELNWHF